MDVLPCAYGKPWLPVVASNGNMNLLNRKGKTNMKTSILVAAIMAGALATPFASAQDKSLSAPAVSAQKRSVPARQAMRMDMMQMMMEQMMQHDQMMESLPVK